ncbi:MAG TPA: HD domain-containing protein [Gemmatimonadaceae bacterium]|nr:HD domain-containing protein [Gemmatimonadaceae bacterium]
MLDLSSLAAGDRVQHELVVRGREDKTTKNGDPFAVLQLGNATGAISANVWKEQLPWIEGVRAGSVVQVIGAVEHYQGRRQLKLTAPLRVIAAAAANLEQFLPRISIETPRLWEQVDKWRHEMRSAKLHAAVDLFFADDAFRAAFERAPGAPRGHHAQIGGLLLHVVEVGTIVRGAARTMHADVDLVTAGALLHDIGKVEAYAISAAGFENSEAGYLVQHVVLGSIMLDRRLRTLPAGTLTDAQALELHHFIQSHHGLPEHGAAVRPMTLEAELLHWADQMSANGNNFLEAVEDPELFPGDEEFSVRKSWRLDRRVWRRPHQWD